jgi:hypothetical protein
VQLIPAPACESLKQGAILSSSSHGNMQVFGSFPREAVKMPASIKAVHGTFKNDVIEGGFMIQV